MICHIGKKIFYNFPLFAGFLFFTFASKMHQYSTKFPELGFRSVGTVVDKFNRVYAEECNYRA